MGNMDSSYEENMDSWSRETLFLVYRGISGWRSDQGNLIGEIPWTESHVHIVCAYIKKLSSNKSDFKLPISAEDLPVSREIVESFIRELQKFFVVPKLRQLYGEDNPKALKKNELFAAFLCFLLELLHQKIRLVHSFKDQIDDLKKELRFLVTVLGDALLINDELEQVNNLLAEFEQVANEAGNLVYSFIFAMDGVYLATRMEDDLNALFDHIHLLKDNIIKSSNLVDDHTTQRTVVVHSLFIVDSLLYNLEDLMNKHDDRIVDVKEQIKALHQELMFSKSLLDDIKLQQCMEIEEAMTRIKDVGYEAEYLINSFLVGDAPLWYLTIRLPKVIHKIKLIGTELEEIKKKCYKNRVLEVEEDVNAQPSLQGKMHCQVDGFTIGLEDKANHVLDHLVGGPQHLQIIIISGMPGLGKTTLAKKLYNHPTINYYFDRRAWCIVSQTYQRKSPLIDILISLPSEREVVSSKRGEERLGECIYKSLKGRRYLIVMDDAWDSNAWDDFRRYFPDDRNGSRILLTGRNEDVAPPNSIIYALPSLSNDQCWELLQKQVFRDEPCPPELQCIGKEIAKNCHGLPLAVVVTAGILSTMDKEERTWKNVEQRLPSYISSDKNNSTMQILELSYKHLPAHLKPCFLYLGAFLEDAEIPVKKLKYIWIAEGFIPNYKMLRTAEDVAEQYLMELIGRSLVVVAKRRSDGGAKACVVHDLLRDLCLRIAEEENCLLMEHDWSLYTRHPLHRVQADYFPSFGLHSHSLFGSRLKAPLNFVNMKLLKLLVLPRGEFGHGDGSENLVHLRYLVTKYMPASIGSLGNLEFLTVMDRQYEFSIASVIEKLTKLKYLSVPLARFDKNSNNYQTNNLEFLSHIDIEKPEDENMLKCSPHLRKLKCTLSYLLDNHCLDLSFLTQLESLNVSRYSETQAIVEINFPLNIRKLRLYGLLLPWEKMTTIGRLPKLEVLKLECVDFVGERWDTRDGEFQQLKFLKLNWIRITEWNVASSKHFPMLQRLVLRNCYDEVKEIPCAFGEIATLQLIEVFHCQKLVAESAAEIQEKQREMGNEELRVIINNITDSFRRSPCFPDVIYNLEGENMDSCSRETLLLVYQGISRWRSNRGHLIGEIPWNESHVSTVCFYILKLNSIKSDFKLLSSAKDLAFSREIVESCIQELQKFFVVPKLRQLYGEDNPKALKKNELFAAFLSFLLELLHQKIYFVHSFEDRIEDLKKELRFLVTILGDTLLIDDELEQVNNLLAEFEQVANEAGNFVYSFIFAMDGEYLATRMEDDLNALFDHIHLLQDNIIKSSNLVDDHTTQRTVVHSLFIVDSLLYNLENLMNKHDDRIVDVKEQIEALCQELMRSKSLLEDMKLQRCIEIEEVMTRIRDVGYEAEYLINSFLVGDAPLRYLTIRLAKVIYKIRLIGTEPEEIKKKYYNIRVLEVAEDMNAQLPLQGRMHHEVDGFTIGLEDKTTHDVLDQLVGGPQDRRQIIIITGMPGLGKTTLAKKLYNDPNVKYHFHRCAWCVVSQTYQRRSLLIDILISLGIEHDKVKISNMEEEQLCERIYKGLKGRRYLIVMDDVWDSNAWDDFRRYFPDDRNGSRILLTSRNEDVAPPNSIIHALRPLSNDQCWVLLQKKVFHDEPCPLELQRIGKEIAENCHGLPLAVVVAAGILSTMDREEHTWKNVGQKLASYIFSDKNNSMMQILKLSYEHLPEHLKPCFLYFGAFPEDAEIPVKKLKNLWIAEGFMSNYKMLKTAEEVAEKYLVELIDRSLVMVAKRRVDGGAKVCVVHDLLRELCMRIAEEENFLKLMEYTCSIYTRHSRLHVRALSSQSFGLHIRTLFGSHLETPLNFLNMKLLKLLVLPSNELRHGDGSENLVQLRCLVIKYMPASICSLGNLEFLTVMMADKSKVSISSVIEKLTKLKYLSVPEAHFDKNSNNYQTNNLEFLSNINIDNPEDENMLKCSPHLRKLKCTSYYEARNHCLDLSFLTQLKSLNINKPGVVEINFPLNIRKLKLFGLCLPWEKMTIIGRLPKLEVLKLYPSDFVGKRWDTRDGEFQQLKFLELNWMRITEWNVASREHFPRLQRLFLWSCPFLKEIPCEIGKIATLQLIKVSCCGDSVVESAREIQEEQREMGNEELRVITDGITETETEEEDPVETEEEYSET